MNCWQSRNHIFVSRSRLANAFNALIFIVWFFVRKLFQIRESIGDFGDQIDSRCDAKLCTRQGLEPEPAKSLAIPCISTFVCYT
jgi:hypothetical protein